MWQAIPEALKKALPKKRLVCKNNCAVGAIKALFVKKGIEEEELPKTDRGRKYMMFKYGSKEIRRFYLSLRESLHIEGYYDGTLSFEEMEECPDELK